MELRIFLYLSPPVEFHSSLQQGLSVTLATSYLFSLFSSAPVTIESALLFVCCGGDVKLESKPL